APVDQAALAPPVEEAGRALADKLGPARLRQRRDMRVRQMREHEHGKRRMANTNCRVGKIAYRQFSVAAMPRQAILPPYARATSCGSISRPGTPARRRPRPGRWRRGTACP